MSETQVVVVGAGPTGLVLALFLARQGVKPRIIDKRSGPGQASRAMAVQARTLEFYRQLGFADEVVAKGIQIEQIQMRNHGHIVSRIDVAELGEGQSPYPYLLSFPQDDHEKLLGEHLSAEGVAVEWGTELVGLRDTGGDVRATLRGPGGAEEECAVSYLCGCDGAHSTVRQALGLGFGGGTYEKAFFVADVSATGEAASGNTFSFCTGANDFILVFPIRSTGMQRLIGVVPADLAGREDLSFEDVRAFAERSAQIHIESVNWFSKYRVHHRVADHFRAGRVFISGDAGHIHSPAGGQGMNTGIGDAVNLAWKAAAVIQGRADASLLDTYEEERIAFARSLVASTDKLFQVMVGSGLGNQLFRDRIFPHLAPFLLGFPGLRAAAFRLISQTRINYHGSALSEGEAGDVHGGDRLPWAPLPDGIDNFAPLRSVDWQVHVYGEPGAALRDAAAEANLALHAFPWSGAMERAGLKKDALYLVRPDGYVALADDEQDVQKLRSILHRFAIVPMKEKTE